MAKEKDVGIVTIGRFIGKITKIDRKKKRVEVKTPCGKVVKFHPSKLPNRVKARIGLPLKFTIKQQGEKTPFATCIKLAK